MTAQNISQVAAIFGATPEQVASQYRKNARDIRSFTPAQLVRWGKSQAQANAQADYFDHMANGTQDTLAARIAQAIAGTPDFSRERKQALAAIRWRMKHGLLYAGLNSECKIILVSADDSRVSIFDGRDNEAMKVGYANAVTGYKFEIELL